MADRLKVSIVGASGYTGGELLRLLLWHPRVEVCEITSERFAGKFVFKAHPNLRKRTQLRFCRMDELKPCDVLFICLPHGQAMERFESLRGLAPKLIDLSADFLLNDPNEYQRWYGKPHARPDLMKDFVYGVPRAAP